MNKIAKRIVAGVSAMALTFSSVAMTASATEGKGTVNNVPVTYSTSLTANYSLSTSYFGDDPTRHKFELMLDIYYGYINTGNGDLTESSCFTPKTSGGGTGRQIFAPTNCTMSYASTHHYFWADGVLGEYDSLSIR